MAPTSRGDPPFNPKINRSMSVVWDDTIAISALRLSQPNMLIPSRNGYNARRIRAGVNCIRALPNTFFSRCRRCPSMRIAPYTYDGSEKIEPSELGTGNANDTARAAMKIGDLFLGLTEAVFAKIGRERAREISQAQNAARDLGVAAWAKSEVPHRRFGFSEELRAEIRKPILQTYRMPVDEIEERAARRIARILKDKDEERAKVLLQTEMTRLTGYASLHDMRQAGFKYKMWMTCRDGFSRPSHAALEGRVVAIDAPFITASGARAPYPGGFGVAEEDDGCRCAIRAVLPGEVDPKTGKRYY